MENLFIIKHISHSPLLSVFAQQHHNTYSSYVQIRLLKILVSLNNMFLLWTPPVVFSQSSLGSHPHLQSSLSDFHSLDLPSVSISFPPGLQKSPDTQYDFFPNRTADAHLSLTCDLIAIFIVKKVISSFKFIRIKKSIFIFSHIKIFSNIILKIAYLILLMLNFKWGSNGLEHLASK